MAQIPGLTVVIPSTPYDAKGLLISAIRDEIRLSSFEHMKLYRSFRQEVPEGEYTIPLVRRILNVKVKIFPLLLTVPWFTKR